MQLNYMYWNDYFILEMSYSKCTHSCILVQDLKKKTSTVVTNEAQGTLYVNEFLIFVRINYSTADWLHSASGEIAPNNVQSR